jgi:hypothetical protein
MICPNCRAEIPDSAKFCVNCGYSLPADSAQAHPAQTYAPPVQQTPPQQSYATTAQQVYAPQASYAAPSYAAPAQGPVSILAYIGMILLSGVPFLGFIGIIIIAAVAQNKSIKNFCIAMIILSIVTLALAILLGGTLAAFASQYAGEIRNFY